MNALRIVFLALAVGVLGLLGWRSVAIRPGAEPSPALATLREAMRTPTAGTAVPALPVVARPAERVADVPDYAGFYGRLKTEFPRDYDAVTARLRAGGNGPAPDADAAIWDALRDLEQADGVLAAQAAPQALDRFFDARSAVLDGLAPIDARQCVDFLYGATDTSIAPFTAAHRGLVATLAERTLDAIADGRLRHLDRTAPTEADLDALSAGLAARRLSPVEIGLLIDGTTPDPPLPDGRVCEIGRTYLDVLRGLPDEARQRIYGLAAELLARS